METGCNTKTIAYENRTFLVNMLNFENGMIISISENSPKIGPMLISISSGPVASTSIIIPTKSEELFLKLLSEKISSFLKGICLVTANFERSLDNNTTKQLMHEIMGEITQ
ncbi:MAG: hypothetical protein HOC53_00360 [Candidatus Nitrosopelagicus sp.]|nr:hypothetical protein [Candidatus Nitrosopelagicus sp.]